jgi:hypothetical protein
VIVNPRIKHFFVLGYAEPPYFRAPKGSKAIITERGRLGDQSFVKGYWFHEAKAKPLEESYTSPFDGKTK